MANRPIYPVLGVADGERDIFGLWAGHGLDVLLRVCARCLDGGEQEARRRAEGGFAGF